MQTLDSLMCQSEGKVYHHTDSSFASIYIAITTPNVFLVYNEKQVTQYYMYLKPEENKINDIKMDTRFYTILIYVSIFGGNG